MPDPGRPFFIRHPDLAGDGGADNPPAPQPQAETQQTPPAETTPAPEPRLYAGKYKTPEELEAGYENSFRELDRIRNGYEEQLRQVNARADALIARFAEPTPPPEDPFALSPDQEMTPDWIARAVRAEARRISREVAREESQAAITPLIAGNTARGRVASRYADFIDSEQALSNFVQSDAQTLATYNRMFGTDPEAAMEWAYLRYRAANPASTPRVSAADKTPGGEITSQRTTEQRAEAPESDRAAEEERGLRYYHKYGIAQPYLRARFKGLIPDSHFKEG